MQKKLLQNNSKSTSVDIFYLIINPKNNAITSTHRTDKLLAKIAKKWITIELKYHKVSFTQSF